MRKTGISKLNTTFCAFQTNKTRNMCAVKVKRKVKHEKSRKPCKQLVTC